MKTIELNIYKFDELIGNARNTAIEEIRQKRYNCNDYSGWVIDDCYLFEPKHHEMIRLCGEEYNQHTKPVMGNTGKVYFSVDRDRYLDADEGIVVNNDKMFFNWLEIPEELHDRLYYTIKNTWARNPDTIIRFEENDISDEFTDEEMKILENAQDKFADHMENVLNLIGEAYDYYFSDECIKDEIEGNEYEFTEDGKIY